MNLGFDLKTVAGMSAIAMFFLSTIKKLFLKQVESKEPIIAVVIGLALSVTAHLANTITFKPGVEGWIETIAAGLSVAAGAQVGHDYVLNPAKGLVSNAWVKALSFFSKKKDGGGDEKTP